jgi:hypothetical protein
MYLKDTEQIYLSGSDFCGFFEAFAAERPDEKAKISKGLTLRLKWLGTQWGTGQKKPEIVVWAKKSAVYNPFFCK